jgi:hypothetical protein
MFAPIAQSLPPKLDSGQLQVRAPPGIAVLQLQEVQPAFDAAALPSQPEARQLVASATKKSKMNT